jgi:hypothetical protein
MKRNIIPLLILFVSVLSSCVTNNISIVKRKYSSGYYVNVNHHKNVNGTPKANHLSNDLSLTSPQNIEKTPKKIEGPKLTVVESLLSDKETSGPKQNYTASTGKSNSILSTINKKQSITNHNSKIKFGEENIHELVDKNKISDTKISKLLKAGHKTQAELILLVILSIFPLLALLAMYLKDGEEITMNFWVDLILHLTVVGYIIFALLVVFDIVNLA